MATLALKNVDDLTADQIRYHVHKVFGSCENLTSSKHTKSHRHPNEAFYYGMSPGIPSLDKNNIGTMLTHRVMDLTSDYGSPAIWTAVHDSGSNIYTFSDTDLEIAVARTFLKYYKSTKLEDV